jgi:Protein of unknown function (DUF1353)
MTGFSPGAKVVVEELDDNNWMVREPFSYTGKTETFRIECGMETDFASVPRVFVWFLPRYGRYTLAAILHDYLWQHRASTGAMDYIDADGTFRRAMRELGVPFLQRWMMWAAVRWAALLKPDGRRGWWREAWRVLLITVVALPIAVPPAVVIGLTLGLFHVVELAVWALLKLTHRAQRHRGRVPPKQVNRPTFDWRL